MCLVVDTVTTFGARYGPHLANFSVGYVLFAYASVPAVVTARFDAGFAAVGLLMSGALGTFALVQLVGGRVVDGRSPGRLLLGLVVLHALLSVALDLAPTFYSLVALRAVWGLVGGLALTVGATQIARVYEGPTASRHQGIYGGALTLGGAVAFLATPAVVDATGWFGVHAVGGLFALPAVLSLVGADVPAVSTARAAGDGSGSPTDASLLRNRILLLVAGTYAAVLGTYITLSTFVTAYFADLGFVGPLNALALLVASLGRVGGGYAVTHPGLSDGRLIAGAAGVGAVGLLALSAGGGWVLVALPLVVLAAVSLPFGAIYRTAAVSTTRDAAALAVVVATGNLASLVLPVVTGWLRDATGSYRSAFLLLAALNVAATVAGLIVARSPVGGGQK